MKLTTEERTILALKVIKGRKIEDVNLQAEILLAVDAYEEQGITKEEEEENIRDIIFKIIKRWKRKNGRNVHCKCGMLNGVKTLGHKCNVCSSISKEYPDEDEKEKKDSNIGECPNEIPYGIDLGLFTILQDIGKFL